MPLALPDPLVSDPQVQRNLEKITQELGGKVEAARVFHNAAQSAANNAYTVLAFNSERFDTGEIHDTATNNSRLTCKVAGLYVITGHIEFAANSTGLRIIDVFLNGATQIAQLRTPTTSGPHLLSIATLYQLVVNDYVQLRAYQDSGVALNVESDSRLSPEFAMSRLGTV